MVERSLFKTTATPMTLNKIYIVLGILIPIFILVTILIFNQFGGFLKVREDKNFSFAVFGDNGPNQDHSPQTEEFFKILELIKDYKLHEDLLRHMIMETNEVLESLKFKSLNVN